MPLHAVAEAVIGLEVVGHRVAVAERVALVVVVRQIFRKLVVHLELEALRHLLLHADRHAAVERLGGTLQRGQLADAIGPAAAQASAPGRPEDRVIAVDEAAGVDGLRPRESPDHFQIAGQRLFQVEAPRVGARIGEVLVGHVHLRMVGRQVAGVRDQLVVGRRSQAKAVEGRIAIDGLAHRTVGGTRARQIQAGRARVIDAAAQSDQSLALLAGRPYQAEARLELRRR